MVVGARRACALTLRRVTVAALLALLLVPTLLVTPVLAADVEVVAQEETDEAEEGDEDAEEGDDADDDEEEAGGEQFRGTLVTGDDEPIPGVVITVETPDGEVVGQVESDDEGNWAQPVPEPGDYVVTLQTDTLPEGVELRDPDRASLETNVRTGQERTLLFPFGEAAEVTPFTQRLISQTFNGLKFGVIIAIAAIGLSLIFGTTGLVNFSHGELVTTGAVIAWFLNAPAGVGAGIQLIGAGAIAVVISAAIGGAIDRGLWQPLRKRRTGLIQMLVITIGMMLVLRNVNQLVFGSSSRPYFDYTIQDAFVVGPLRVTPRDLIVLLLALVVLVLVATMLQRTRIGKAMRAVSDNRDLAESSGINVTRVILVIWILGTGLAGFGGILNGLVENVSFIMGFRLLLLMFAGVILGGLGTAYGAMFGSIVVGLVTELSTLFFSTELKLVWALFVLIIILLVRPQGLLGRAERIG